MTVTPSTTDRLNAVPTASTTTRTSGTVAVVITERFPSTLLLSGDMTDGDDRRLLSGDMTDGDDAVALSGLTGPTISATDRIS